MTRHLLFVCSGNITRSPMAAALAELEALRRAFDVDVASAGTLGIEGQPAHPRMVAIARSRGLDLTRHRSRGLTADALAWADRVAVMEPEHASIASELAPECAGKLVQLAMLVGEPQITDPTGSWLAGPYRATADKLQRAIVRLVQDEITRPRRP